LLILIGLCVAMTIASPFFLTGRNIQNLGVQASIVAALALGQLLVVIVRGIDVSVGSVIAFSAMVGAVVAGGSGLLIVVVILLAGAAIGVLNGGLIVLGKLPQPLIVTLASLGIARGLAQILNDGETIVGLPPVVTTLGGGFVGPFPVPVLIILGAATVLWALTTRTQWGRWLYAVGGNLEAAKRLGVPTGKVVMSAYVICGLMAGLAGLLTAGRTDSATPLAGAGLELDAVTAVIIGGASLFGGRGSVFNALIGALVLGVIRNGLDLLSVEPFYQTVTIGVVIVIALEIDVIRGRFEDRLRVIRSQAGVEHAR
jgi:ribose transport system permease protein